jgi:hypothetical protein
MCNPKANYAQIIEDTGQIFIEISNIISSMPGHSGNDYNDPDTSDLNSWGNIMDYIFAGNYAQADLIADSLGYDVVQFTDTSESVHKTYYILKNYGSNYWGTYVYYPDYCRPLVIQVPHPLKEINTGQQGIHVFQKTEALFFCLSGTSRCNHSSYSSCSGTTTICSGSSESYRISDMAHSVSSIFQKTTEKLLTGFSNTFFVQLHGFAQLVSDPYLIISNGTQVTPGRDYSVLLQNNLLIEDTTLTFKIAHIDLSWTRLRAFDNTQGRLINSSTDACYANATTTNGRFLSIEQERTKLRDDVTGWNKMANALINTFVCYPFLWDGSSDTDWNTAANWRENAVPASSDNVTIANKLNKPVINEDTGSPAICNHLEIQPDASLTINPGKALSVNGALDNFGSIIIKSDVSGTGSLIHSTGNVNAIVERYLTQEKWHFIGMPVETDSAGVFYLPGGSDIYLRTHIESTNTWGDWIVSVNTPLILGRGYECWVDDNVNQDETVEFSGTLNAGDYTTGCGFYGLEYTSGHGLNLICNPYPSALQANIGSWVKNNVASSVWTWSDAHGNYVYWGSGNNYGGESFGTLTSGVIPAMQAFFVEATGSLPSLTIPQSDRIHSSQAYYKESVVLPYTIRLDVEGNGYQDAIFVCFNEYATAGFDLNYDVRKIYGLEEAPQLYSFINDGILSLNTLPKTDDYISLQVGFECAATEVFTIEASETESFESGIDIYLEDLKDDVIHNLSLNPLYTFNHSPINNANRFVLHFGSPNGIDEQSLNNFTIFAKDNKVYILDPQAGEVNIVVHDIAGREILNMHLILPGENKILMNGNTGWYIITLISDNFVVSEKVFIR